jgi:DNA-binding IclR family transcriptional regulator
VSRTEPEPLTSVAAPIFGEGNAIIAAMSVVVPSAGVDPRSLRAAVAAVCRAVSRAMRNEGTTVRR